MYVLILKQGYCIADDGSVAKVAGCCLTGSLAYIHAMEKDDGKC